jgi:hypothetical protein
MPNWGLKCKQCSHTFTFAEIEDTLENYYVPVKPVFPKEGLLKECPHCAFKFRYLPHELFYRRERGQEIPI